MEFQKSYYLNLIYTFRKSVINLYEKKILLNKEFAIQFSKWTSSGFSVDNSVFLFLYDKKARASLCQYIARYLECIGEQCSNSGMTSLVSLKEITYKLAKKKIFYHTKYSEYWVENVKLFTTADFIADLTIHIPPKRKRFICYYGLYASRTKDRSKQQGAGLSSLC